jgi:septal ring factor EnvC (AmiA/AmiB activator)
MISDKRGMQLHDRATMGELLTADEQVQLEDWYAQKDAEEAAMLGITNQPDQREQLRAQIQVGLAQIQAVTQSIRQVSEENEGLRQEIATLQQRLSQSA